MSANEDGTTLRYTTSSLDNFIQKYRSRIGQACVIHTKNLCRRGEVLCIPACMTMCL